VVLGAGEELALTYATARLSPPPDGWRRTWFLHNEGWEKDGDPNVACSQTVAPLPSRSMKGYPCPESLDGSSDPASLDDPSPGADRRTRWVSRDRLERRLQDYLESLARASVEPDGKPAP
jgi:hypothetical protein